MTTWEQVKEEASKMQQMGWQSVQQAAKVGQMLIEMKAETPHGEFLANSQRATNLKDKQVNNLMTLARHLPLLEDKRPDSQRQALAIINECKPKREKEHAEPPVRKKALHELGVQYGLLKIGTPAARKKEFMEAVREELGYDIPSKKRIDWLPDEQYQPIESAVRRVAEKRGLLNLETQYQEHRQEVAALPETAKHKIERIAARETQLLREMFKAEVRKEFERTMPDRLKELEERERKATEEIKKYQAMRNGVAVQLSQEDYRYLLGVLHPDRAPEGSKERFAKAFDIVRKLDSYIKALA